jgi:putative PIN family toxin of toxin-antitoxin system
MIVVDANVMLAAFRSANGASHVLLRQMVGGNIPFAVSPAVALEYEDLLKRPGILGTNPWVLKDEIDVVLDALFEKALLVSPQFRFRPFLDDPKDDLYIECAFAAGADTIITNDRHFRHPSVETFGLSVSNAGAFIAQSTKGRPT